MLATYRIVVYELVVFKVLQKGANLKEREHLVLETLYVK